MQKSILKDQFFLFLFFFTISKSVSESKFFFQFFHAIQNNWIWKGNDIT